MSPTAEATVLITHEVGLHARPSVKFTKLAKTFRGAGRGGAWPRRAVVRRQEHRQGDGGQGAEGHGAASARRGRGRRRGASTRWSALVERDFDEGEAPCPNRLGSKGIAGLARLCRRPALRARPAACRAICAQRRRRQPRRPRCATRIAAALGPARALDRDALGARARRDPRIPARHAGGRGADRPGLRRDRRGHAGRRGLASTRSTPRSPATRRPRTTISAPAPPTSATSATRCCARCRTTATSGARRARSSSATTSRRRASSRPTGARRRHRADGRQHGEPRRHAGALARRADGGRARRRRRRHRRHGAARRRAWRHRARARRDADVERFRRAVRTPSRRAATMPRDFLAPTRRDEARHAGARAGQHRRSRPTSSASTSRPATASA